MGGTEQKVKQAHEVELHVQNANVQEEKKSGPIDPAQPDVVQAENEQTVANRQENAQLTQNAQQRLNTVNNVGGAADGNPQQTQTASKRSFKKSKQQESKKVKDAKKRIEPGWGEEKYITDKTYDMAAKSREICYFFRAGARLIYLQGVPQFVGSFRGFHDLFATMAEPHITSHFENDPVELEKVYRNSDMKEDIESGDPEHIRPHMQKMYDQIEQFPVTKESFSEGFMMDNMEQIIRLSTFIQRLDQVKNFDTVSPYLPEGDLLKTKGEKILKLREYMNNYMAGIGVDTVGGEYQTDKKKRSQGRKAAEKFIKKDLDKLFP
jgi:hypothetical protein